MDFRFRNIYGKRLLIFEKSFLVGEGIIFKETINSFYVNRDSPKIHLKNSGRIFKIKEGDEEFKLCMKYFIGKNLYTRLRKFFKKR